MSLADNPFGPRHVVVEPQAWFDEVARLHADGYDYLDWLSAVDEHPEGFRLVVHVARLEPLDHLLVATLLPRDDAVVASLTPLFAGASWHERETHEMFGIAFTSGDPAEPMELAPLLLPDAFEGHPLRKEFVLASRVVKPWPGAKEPGESDADSAHSPGRRRVKPPGVPDDWRKAGPSAAGPGTPAGLPAAGPGTPAGLPAAGPGTPAGSGDE